MDIRNKYQKEGQCYFPIKSIDEEFYNYLSEHYKSNDGTTHLRDKYWPGEIEGFRSGFRFDAGDESPVDEFKYTDHNKPFHELELKKKLAIIQNRILLQWAFIPRIMNF